MAGVLKKKDLPALKKNNAQQVAKKILEKAPTGIELLSGKPAVRVDFRNARAIARGSSAAAIAVVAYNRVQKQIGREIGKIAFKAAMRANLGFSAAASARNVAVQAVIDGNFKRVALVTAQVAGKVASRIRRTGAGSKMVQLGIQQAVKLRSSGASARQAENGGEAAVMAYQQLRKKRMSAKRAMKGAKEAANLVSQGVDPRKAVAKAIKDQLPKPTRAPTSSPTFPKVPSERAILTIQIVPPVSGGRTASPKCSKVAGRCRSGRPSTLGCDLATRDRGYVPLSA